MCNEFRFFTTLRCAQNDREGVLRCVQNDRGEGAAFGMTGGRGGCVQNDRMGRPRNDREGALFGMAGIGPCRFE